MKRSFSCTWPARYANEGPGVQVDLAHVPGAYFVPYHFGGVACHLPPPFEDLVFADGELLTVEKARRLRQAVEFFGGSITLPEVPGGA